ncbi:hypothetical protein PAXRUDRAFT_28209 [Paxillus rubicundulus Ve08.2h10]|uniref:Uncharacterized protein n=1 Tax=Paxillus rubicundulus Ve08.2h10 TaxID=930991 RepID=A0A0D0DNM9_9AGAM|nr:hypothetical protein PAXRUDRAFT_28209 [Paxillus rubicundulus Ve08.2h10]
MDHNAVCLHAAKVSRERKRVEVETTADSEVAQPGAQEVPEVLPAFHRAANNSKTKKSKGGTKSKGKEKEQSGKLTAGNKSKADRAGKTSGKGKQAVNLMEDPDPIAAGSSSQHQPVHHTALPTYQYQWQPHPDKFPSQQQAPPTSACEGVFQIPAYLHDPCKGSHSALSVSQPGPSAQCSGGVPGQFLNSFQVNYG